MKLGNAKLVRILNENRLSLTKLNDNQRVPSTVAVNKQVNTNVPEMCDHSHEQADLALNIYASPCGAVFHCTWTLMRTNMTVHNKDDDW